MLLESTPINQAILGNTKGETEFKIKASAKAFSILSSGLYANKIRSIIRELSCNAYDSHVAAGKKDTPFEVHLPNSLEPWFSVKDFGTGLSVSEVQHIYSTYFESTKNNSNDFIGALGLGSKSPFSYTDNFSVESIKDGTCALFSCIINDNGVPSTVLMSEYQTDKPNGVEVKFSVNDRFEFNKFISEASIALMHFDVKPIIKGCSNFKFNELTFVEKNLLPDVDIISDSDSYALMGNVAYPIEKSIIVKNYPEADSVLQYNQNLLIRFNIGDLDIQASREGLSYIPSTIKCIADKIEKVSNHCIGLVEKELTNIQTLKDKIIYLSNKNKVYLFTNAVNSIIKNDKILSKMFEYGSYSGIKLDVQHLKDNYNINIRAFSEGWNKKVSEDDSRLEYDYSSKSRSYRSYFKINFLTESDYLLVNTSKTAKSNKNISRIKYTIEENKFNKEKLETVFVLEPEDLTKEMKLKEFYLELYDLHSDYILSEVDLLTRPKKPRVQKIYQPVGVLKYNAELNKFVRAGLSSDGIYQSNNIKYYLPVSNTQLTEECAIRDIVQLTSLIRKCGIKELFGITIYGVRKSDIKNIKLKLDWINLDTLIKKELMNVSKQDISKYCLVNSDLHLITTFLNSHSYKVNNSILFNTVKDYKYIYNAELVNLPSIEQLMKAYKVPIKVLITAPRKTEEFNKLAKVVYERYPLLKIAITNGDSEYVIQYIKAIDTYLSSNDKLTEKETTHE